jgi:hypothetical protein
MCSPYVPQLSIPSLPPDVEWSGFPDPSARLTAAVPVGKLDIPLPEDGILLFFVRRP